MKGKKDKRVKSKRKEKNTFSKLLRILEVLRSPTGCPWDKEQTPSSLREPLIEETFELISAINKEDAGRADYYNIKEEAGDVLLNLLMIVLIYQERGKFSIKECINELCDKLIRRHPHVFNKDNPLYNKLKTGEEVLDAWDEIKKSAEHKTELYILDGIPKAFPPLLRAYKMQKKVAKVGFDWDVKDKSFIKDIKALTDKITEEGKEVEEVKKKLKKGNKGKNGRLKAKLECEGGDLLFSVVNYLRHLGINPDIALTRSCDKFYKRFCYVEKKMREKKVILTKENRAEEEKYWQEAKLLDE